MKSFIRLAAILVLSAVFSLPARAATVTFADLNSLVQKTSYNVGAGSNFSIDIIALGFAELAGGTIDLGYDESLVMINSVTIDPYWDFNPTSGSDSGANTWGTITFDAFVNDPATFDTRIATISLTALSPGVSPLNILGSSQFFSTTVQLTPTIGNATITVAAVPVPPALWLMISGLGLLFARARKK